MQPLYLYSARTLRANVDIDAVVDVFLDVAIYFFEADLVFQVSRRTDIVTLFIILLAVATRMFVRTYVVSFKSDDNIRYHESHPCDLGFLSHSLRVRIDSSK